MLGKKVSVTYKTCNLQSISSLLNAGLKAADCVVINMPQPGLGDAEADAQVSTNIRRFVQMLCIYFFLSPVSVTFKCKIGLDFA